MSIIRKAKPRVPGTGVDDRLLLWAKVLRLQSLQTPNAADATVVLGIADQPMKIRQAYATLNQAPTGADTLTFDLQRNPVGGGGFASLLLAVLSTSVASVAGVQYPVTFSVAFEAAGRLLAAGDVLEVIRDETGAVAGENLFVVELEPAA